MLLGRRRLGCGGERRARRRRLNLCHGSHLRCSFCRMSDASDAEHSSPGAPRAAPDLLGMLKERSVGRGGRGSQRSRRCCRGDPFGRLFWASLRFLTAGARSNAAGAARQPRHLVGRFGLPRGRGHIRARGSPDLTLAGTVSSETSGWEQGPAQRQPSSG